MVKQNLILLNSTFHNLSNDDNIYIHVVCGVSLKTMCMPHSFFLGDTPKGLE